MTADPRCEIPFKQINAVLLAACPGVLADWFPNGRLNGHEFVVGNLQGDPGESLSINIRTGAWADFADKGNTRARQAATS